MPKRMSLARALEGLRSTDLLTRAAAGRFLTKNDQGGRVPALIGAMEDPDVSVRSGAAWALRSLRQGYDALVAHLNSDPSAHVRVVCALALDMGGYQPPVDALIRALHDEDKRVVMQACMALGKAGHEPAAASLRQLLEHHSWKVRFSACRALHRLGAVDQRVEDTVQALDRQPEASAHNESVLQWREPEAEMGYDPLEWSVTTGELLQVTRESLIGRSNDG